MVAVGVALVRRVDQVELVVLVEVVHREEQVEPGRIRLVITLGMGQMDRLGQHHQSRVPRRTTQVAVAEVSELRRITGRMDIAVTLDLETVGGAAVVKAPGTRRRRSARTTRRLVTRTPVAVVAQVWHVTRRATAAQAWREAAPLATILEDSMGQVSEQWVVTAEAVSSTSRSVLHRRFQLSRPADRSSMVRRGRFQFPQRQRTRKRSRINGRRQNRQQQAHGQMSLAQRRRRIRLVQPSGLRTMATSTGWSSRQPPMV